VQYLLLIVNLIEAQNQLLIVILIEAQNLYLDFLVHPS